MRARLTAGETAPDFNFETPWDGEQGFYRSAGRGPAVLIFLRYIGCPVCQASLSAIKRNIDFVNKKASIFVALQSAPASVAAAVGRDDLPFTIICDPESKIYGRYGVRPGGIAGYLHPAGLVAAVKAVIGGHKHGKFEGRETQVPAAFVINADRKILFVHYGTHINDIPSLETLASYLEGDNQRRG